MRAASLLLAGGAILFVAICPVSATTIREGAERVLGKEPAAGSVLGTLMFYDAGEDLAGGEGGLPYGPGDRAWAERCLGIYDLYRQLGGEKPEGRLRFRRDGARYFISVNGAPGRWFDAPEAALSDLLRLLLARSAAVPEAVAAIARSTPADASLATLAAAIDEAFTDSGGPIVLDPGGVRTLTFAAADIAVGTAGLEVLSDPLDGGGVIASVSAVAGAEGRQAVLGYREGVRFRPVAERDVSVRDGAAPRAPAQEPSAPVGPMPLQDGIAASIARAGETVCFSIPATEGSRLAVTSTGPSDVEAVLLSPDGSVVARNDDGGDGYNFALEADLAAGIYTLEVRHCCAGTGPFSLSVRQD
ncbi:hypothetical protein [Nisaea sediminum]|uniref:hypothetical protein n=1 Tax=Nisaea sediminum TaxID=2775867 RepID=UPI001867C9E7|nr:hypothetical protein [Nisaea sediminum]